MLNQFEIPALLVDKLPEIQQELKNNYATLNIFKSLQCLADHTKQKLEEHDMQGVKRSLAVAEYIYSRGNKLVRNAVETIFIYSLSSLLKMGSIVERRQLQSIMPLYLYTAYVQQALKPCI